MRKHGGVFSCFVSFKGIEVLALRRWEKDKSNFNKGREPLKYQNGRVSLIPRSVEQIVKQFLHKEDISQPRIKKC